MKQEKNWGFDKKIPNEIIEMIEAEVERLVSTYRDEDPWTAEQDAEMEIDNKMAEYLLLDWLYKSRNPKSILYAGSGSDFLPKYVFGEDKVVHSSMEDYDRWGIKYFPELGSGQKVVADNINLPFSEQSFDLVLFFGLCVDSTPWQLEEAERVLKMGGSIVCDQVTSENIDLKNIFPDSLFLEVPDYIQNRGVSETYFTIISKL
jgi:hypothetical protein